MAQHNKIGFLGEGIASNWLNNNGFTLIERNYREKWGEIDIIAEDSMKVIHFIEVKTVSYETREKLDWSVSYGTYRPEENVHSKKQKRLSRAIETWLFKKKYSGIWQIDIVTVRIVLNEKYCKIKFMKNIIFE